MNQPNGKVLGNRPLQLIVHLALCGFAAFVCWHAVSWALRPGLFLIMDELGNLTRFVKASYGQIVTLFPHVAYNDRPLGFALEQLLFQWFGFDYHRQIICFLAIHFANCGLGFMLLKRLGVSVPLSIGAIGLYGGLWTTAATASYLGAAFDVLCLFFLLGSALAFLSDRRGAAAFSAVLFLLALRTKEFAILTPAVFVPLALFMMPRSLPPPRQILIWTVRRMWMHLAIGLVFGVIYLTLFPQLRAITPPSSPYHMEVDARTVLDSWSYYTRLIFGQDGSTITLPRLSALALGATLIYSVIRRDMAVLFGLAGYVLYLLPVSLLPKQRAPFYVYAPQLFLILAGCLLLERLIAVVTKREPVRWVAAASASFALLLWATVFRGTPYFRGSAEFNLTARSVSATTAADVQTLLSKLPPGAHIYVNHGDRIPWLFAAGPCAYFQTIERDLSIRCVIGQPETALRDLYANDKSPKYFLEYGGDGLVKLGDASPGQQ